MAGYVSHQPAFERMSGRYSEIRCKNGIVDDIMLFYEFRMGNEAGDRSFAVPGGCTDIIICCSEGEQSARICGSATRGRRVSYKPERDYFGIRFLPGRHTSLFGYPAKDFTDREILLRDIRKNDRLVEKVSSAGSIDERVTCALKYMSDCLTTGGDTFVGRAPNDGRLRLSGWIVGRVLETAGHLRIEQLADETGYSTRYISKVFNDNIGLNPKLFCRIVRFQKSLDIILNDGLSSFCDIACELGYFDQSHFSKEFREFTTISPSQMAIMM
jgi:AraC-like DNA-binding protein